MADIGGGKGAKVLEALTTDDALGRHCFRQPKDGYRFSVDSVLLAAFATKTTGPVADLGAGCGVLSVLLHNRGFEGPFCCVEIDRLAAKCCRHNLDLVKASAEVLCQDLSASNPKLKRGAFTMVVSNPPFTKAGHGRISPKPSRARARQELTMKAEILWQRAAELLCRGGRIALCWPPARLVEALSGLDALDLRPIRLRLVHGRQDKPARVALIEAVKQSRAQLEVEPSLIVYEKDRNYTTEVQAIYDLLN